jgi:hypothetical protein
MKVKVARIDAQALRELAVRQGSFLALTEHLEDPQAERVTESLQLLRTIDREDIEQRRLRLGL